jgi:hypothetical protein
MKRKAVRERRKLIAARAEGLKAGEDLARGGDGHGSDQGSEN